MSPRPPSSPLALNLTSVAALLLLPLVVTYFGVLYSAFSGPVETESEYGGGAGRFDHPFIPPREIRGR